MKIISHGKYYYAFVTIECKRCGCYYQLEREDIKKYNKPKKIWKCASDDMQKEKYDYYTNCPECNYDNELEYSDYDILTFDIKGEQKCKN